MASNGFLREKYILAQNIGRCVKGSQVRYKIVPGHSLAFTKISNNETLVSVSTEDDFLNLIPQGIVTVQKDEINNKEN